MQSATIAEAMNSVVARIDALSHPSGKNSFVDAVRSCNGDRTMLAAFARQYHFFSLMQASLLPLLIQCFEATDVVARADLSQILADEYGNGDCADPGFTWTALRDSGPKPTTRRPKLSLGHG